MAAHANLDIIEREGLVARGFELETEIPTALAPLLDRLGRRSLLFAGFTTGTCVESSLRDAVCHDFLATLLEDCCGAYTQRAHDRAVAAVQEGFGVVTNSDEVIRNWRRAERRADEVVASA